MAWPAPNQANGACGAERGTYPAWQQLLPCNSSVCADKPDIREHRGGIGCSGVGKCGRVAARSSRYRGVTASGTNGWRARVRFGQDTVYLGRFKDEHDAAAAYDRAAALLFDRKAELNFGAAAAADAEALQRTALLLSTALGGRAPERVADAVHAAEGAGTATDSATAKRPRFEGPPCLQQQQQQQQQQQYGSCWDQRALPVYHSSVPAATGAAPAACCVSAGLLQHHGRYLPGNGGLLLGPAASIGAGVVTAAASCPAFLHAGCRAESASASVHIGAPAMDGSTGSGSSSGRGSGSSPSGGSASPDGSVGEDDAWDAMLRAFDAAKPDASAPLPPLLMPPFLTAPRSNVDLGATATPLAAARDCWRAGGNTIGNNGGGGGGGVSGCSPHPRAAAAAAAASNGPSAFLAELQPSLPQFAQVACATAALLAPLPLPPETMCGSGAVGSGACAGTHCSDICSEGALSRAVADGVAFVLAARPELAPVTLRTLSLAAELLAEPLAPAAAAALTHAEAAAAALSAQRRPL